VRELHTLIVYMWMCRHNSAKPYGPCYVRTASLSASNRKVRRAVRSSKQLLLAP
jgi:hypothetical protein